MDTTTPTRKGATMATTSPAIVSTVTGIISRVARQGGHIGDIRVTNVRANARGYSARVTLSRCGGRYVASYRATIVGSKVRLVRVSDPVKVAA